MKTFILKVVLKKKSMEGGVPLFRPFLAARVGDIQNKKPWIISKMQQKFISEI